MPQMELLFLYEQLFTLSVFFIVSLSFLLVIDFKFNFNKFHLNINYIRLVTKDLVIYILYKRIYKIKVDLKKIYIGKLY